MSDENNQAAEGQATPAANPTGPINPIPGVPTPRDPFGLGFPTDGSVQLSPEQLELWKQTLDAAQKQASAATEPVTPIETPAPINNARQTSEVFLELETNPKDGGPKASDPAVVAMPGNTVDWIQAELSKININDLAGTPNGVYWGNLLDNAESFTRCTGEFFQESVNRPQSTWHQFVDTPEGPIAISAPKFGDTSDSVVSGHKALMKMRHLLNLGTVNFIPLYHSGFHIHLKAPSNSAVLELDRKLAESKISLGRSTFGLAFTNSSVLYAQTLVTFIADHIYDTSVKTDGNPQTILSMISILDLPTLIWAIVSLMYPRGFPYVRSVISQEKGQTRTIKGKVAVPKMFWVDTSKLTSSQKTHMAKRTSGRMTVDEVAAYRKEFTLTERRIKVNDHIFMDIKTPNILEYLEAGERWINGLIDMVTNAMTQDPGAGARDAAVNDQGKASAMRQYAHYVTSITTDDKTTANDTDTICQILDMMSAVDDAKEQYFSEIKKFIEETTMSVIAVPASEPEDVAPLPRFPHLIPIDAGSVFFILLVRKALEIRAS